MATIVVTGGTGFVGRAVIADLLNRDYDVVCLVRDDGTISSLIDHPRAAAIRYLSAGDMTDAEYGAVIPNAATAVVHCAARVHVMRDHAADPLTEFRRVNVDGTLALARHAERKGIGRFVYLSSIKVNGERTRPGHPFRSDDPPAPQDAYGVSKMEAEIGLRALSERTGLAVTIIRPPLVYGPGVKGNFALLAQLVRSRLPLPLGRIKDNRRSLLGVGNLVDLIARCATNSAAINQTFLACDGQDISTSELLNSMADAMGRSILLLPLPPAAICFLARAVRRPELADRLCGSLQVDIAPTEQTLDWRPPLTVAEGLRAAFSPEQQDR